MFDSFELTRSPFRYSAYSARKTCFALSNSRRRSAIWVCERIGSVARIRHKPAWSHYVCRLLYNVQQSLRQYGALEKLRFLLYPINLLPEDEQWIRSHGEGVKWLGKVTNKFKKADLKAFDNNGNRLNSANTSLI